MKITAVILCAGSGSRTGLGYNKLLYNNGLGTVIERTLSVFAGIESITQTVLVHSKEDTDAVEEIAQGLGCLTVLGGSTRFESVYNALSAIDPCDIVIIHDGARPFVSREVIARSIESAVKHGSGITAVPLADTVKTVENGVVLSTPPRSNLYAAQTPQTFKYDLIKDAYQQMYNVQCTMYNKGQEKNKTNSDNNYTLYTVNCTLFTDDASVLEAYGVNPRIIQGDPANIKITTNEDLARLPSDCRIGLGYDVHRFAEGRKLILGGVHIPHPQGLLGHSDADVLTHAIMDALLSAAGLPDIGVLFPDTDKAYKGADSMELLKKVRNIIIRKEELGIRNFGQIIKANNSDNSSLFLAPNYSLIITNISCVVMAAAPRLAPHIAAMRAKIAEALAIAPGQINISATTTEGLGITAGGGISASANCLVRTH